MFKSLISLVIYFGLSTLDCQASALNSQQASLVVKTGDRSGEDSGGGGKSPRPGKILASDTIDLNYFQLFLMDENEVTYKARAGNLCVLPQRNGLLEIHFFNATCVNSKCTFKVRKTLYNPLDKILGCETITPEDDQCTSYFKIQKKSFFGKKVLFSGENLSIELNLCEET